MSERDETLQPVALVTQRGLAFTLFVGLPVAAVAIIALAGHNPLAALIALAVIPLVYLCVSRPENITLFVTFVLFSNAAAVAVKFHGVPFVVAAGIPMLLGVPVMYYVFYLKQKIVISRALPLVCLFILFQMLSTLFSDRPDVSTEFTLTTITEGLALYFLVTNAVRTRQMLRKVIWALLLAGGFLGALSLFQETTRTYSNSYLGFAQNQNRAAFRTEVRGMDVTQPRLEGPIGDQNFYAQFMLMLVPLAMFRIFGEKNFRLKFLAIAAVFLTGAGVALTFSRGAAVGGIMIVAVMCFLRYIKPRHIGAMILGIVIMLQLLPQYGTRLESFERIWGAFNPAGPGISAADRSTKSRLTEMFAAGLAFLDHPVLGVGPGMFRYHYTEYADRVGLRVQADDRAAHDLYLQIAAETGVPGILCFLAILFVTLRDLYRASLTRDDPEMRYLATGLLLSLVSFMTTSLFLGFAFIRYFWLILALGSAIVIVADEQRRAQNLLESNA